MIFSTGKIKLVCGKWTVKDTNSIVKIFVYSQSFFWITKHYTTMSSRFFSTWWRSTMEKDVIPLATSARWVKAFYIFIVFTNTKWKEMHIFGTKGKRWSITGAKIFTDVQRPLTLAIPDFRNPFLSFIFFILFFSTYPPLGIEWKFLPRFPRLHPWSRSSSLSNRLILFLFSLLYLYLFFNTFPPYLYNTYTVIGNSQCSDVGSKPKWFYISNKTSIESKK